MSTKAGLYCGLAAIAIFAILYVIAILQDPEYTFFDNYLSDLGVGPGALAFNSGLMISGALMIPFAIFGLRGLAGEERALRIGSMTVAFSGLFLINIGVFTEDAGDVHFAFSVAFFLSVLVALLILSFGFLKNKILGNTGAGVTVACALLGIILLALGLKPETETVAVLAINAWGLAIAVMGLARERGIVVP